MKPGIYDGQTHAYYAAVPALSRGHVRLDRTWAHTRYAIDHPLADTDALLFGRIVHAAVLSPAQVEREFYFTDCYSYATKEGKSRRANDELAAAGRTVIRGYDALAIAAAVQAHPQAKALLTGGKAEQSVYWQDLEDLCKGRPDYIRGETLIDLKTTQSAAPAQFIREFFRYGYHLQFAWYRWGLQQFTRITKCAVVAVEKTPPYAVAVYHLNNGDLEKAEDLMFARLKEYRACRASGVWPSYDTCELRIPKYLWDGPQEQEVSF